MITDLILARREIEALKLENAHCRATCDELREMLTKAKEENERMTLEVGEGNAMIRELKEQLTLAKAGY